MIVEAETALIVTVGKIAGVNVEITELAGLLEGNTVTCPKHKAKFDVTTGKVISGPKILFMHPKIKDEPTYLVKIEGKDILLEPQ